MAAEVLYARVPAELKIALESYAQERAMTLSACVSELLSLGFDAATKTKSIATLTARTAELESRLVMESSKRQDAEQRNAAFVGAAASWSKRAKHRVGSCRECGKPVLGEDVMVMGACSGCGASVGPTVEKANDLSERDWYLLAGAAGVVLGMLLAGAAK